MVETAREMFERTVRENNGVVPTDGRCIDCRSPLDLPAPHYAVLELAGRTIYYPVCDICAV